MTLPISSQREFAVSTDMLGFHLLKREALRFQVRQKLAASAKVAQSGPGIRAFLLQMLLQPQQPGMNR